MVNDSQIFTGVFLSVLLGFITALVGIGFTRLAGRPLYATLVGAILAALAGALKASLLRFDMVTCVSITAAFGALAGFLAIQRSIVWSTLSGVLFGVIGGHLSGAIGGLLIGLLGSFRAGTEGADKLCENTTPALVEPSGDRPVHSDL
jgi:hypothetical protein